MAFQGSLAELHLPDIIQLISVSGKTGVFHLTDGPLKGQIYLHDGKIVHAQLDDALGEEAVYALAIWSQGDFKFEPGTATELRTISKSNTNLLMEAARRLDEWRVLSKKIPSVDMIPEFVVQDSREGQINLNTSEWLILSKIDGHRSIKTIAGSRPALGVRRVQDPLRPDRDRPHPPARACGRRGAARRRGGGQAAPGRLTGAAHATVQAAPSAPANAPVRPPASPEALGRLNRVRDVCELAAGRGRRERGEQALPEGDATEIEHGAGPEAIDEAINQIARAASILKGPSTTESLLEQLKSIR